MAFSRKLAKQAEEHALMCSERFAIPIHEQIDGTITYSGGAPVSKGGRSIDHVVLEGTTVETAIELAQVHPDRKIAILNFASYREPGGKFLAGASSQEESICHATTLYNVLVNKPEYYELNNAYINRHLYFNRALFTPSITFVDALDVHNVSVLTCAAPNWKEAKKNDVSSVENRLYLKERLKFLKYICEEQCIDTFVLGAWGCGVFKQDPHEVAQLILEVFDTSDIIRSVLHAIPNVDSENYEAFKEV